MRKRRAREWREKQPKPAETKKETLAYVFSGICYRKVPLIGNVIGYLL